MSQAVPPPLPSPITSRHYQAVCGLSLVAIFLVQMEQNLPMLLNALMLVLGALGVMVRARISPLFFFMAMAAGHLIEQYNKNQMFNPDNPRLARFLDIPDVLLCLALLTYLVGQYRLHGLWFNVVQWYNWLHNFWN